MRILHDHFKIAGTKYESAAISLGANKHQTLLYITLPTIKPGIYTACFLSFTISIGQYITTLIIGGGKVVTLSTILIPYISYGNYQLASIYSLVIIMLSLVSYIVLVITQNIFKKVMW